MMTRSVSSTDNLVLGTVNAPWKHSIDAETLSSQIKDGKIDEWLCHMVTFFTEVNPSLIAEFATAHAIDRATLIAAYQKVRTETGESRPELDQL